jgi:hypothetical protein
MKIDKVGSVQFCRLNKKPIGLILNFQKNQKIVIKSPKKLGFILKILVIIEFKNVVFCPTKIMEF